MAEETAVKETPLPWKKVIPVLILLAAEAFNGVSIFAYITLLVIDFKPELRDPETGDVKGAGYYAGMLGSAFFFGQFISSFIWGKMSDKYGRRPILLLGSLGSFICALAFCFTRWYTYSVVVRLLAGILNGNLGVVKTYLGEITDSTNQARAFSWFSLIQGIFGIVGALSGGFLARPAVQYPSVFDKDGFFGIFPYFLANSIAAMLLLAGLVLSYFFLTENEQFRGFKRLSNDEETGVQLQPVEHKDIYSKENGTNTLQEVKLVEETPSRWVAFKERLVKTLPTPIATILGLIPDPEATDDWSITKDKVALLACVQYAVLGFLFVQFDETFPVWTVAKIENGGLGFETQQNGISAAIGGVSVVLIQTLIYRPIVKRLGLLKTFRVGLMISIPTFLAFPNLNWVVIHAPAAFLWMGLCLSYFCRHFAAQLAFTAVIQMVNNSVIPAHMASTNGFGQSLVAFLRAISPLVGGSLTAWSLENGLPFPLNHYFPFIALAIVAGSILLVSFKMPTSLNKPLTEILQESESSENGVT